MMPMDMNKPTLPLLPDLEGEVSLAEGLGLRAATPDLMRELAQNMDAAGEAEAPDALSSLRNAAHRISDRRQEASWRGLLAALLLWETWADTASVPVIGEVTDSTAFSAMVLSARRPEDQKHPLQMITLRHGTKKVSLGIVHPALGVVPPVVTTDLTAMLPKQVVWYRNGSFSDPTEMLNERDRAVLIHRLNLLDGDAARRFAAALLQAGLHTSRMLASGDEAALEQLSLRAMAVCALNELPGLEKQVAAYEKHPAENVLLRALGLSTPVMHEEFPEQATWLWQGEAFARSSMAVGFDAACAENEQQTLRKLAKTERVMALSAAWRYKLVRELSGWLLHHGTERTLAQAAREHLLELRQQAEISAAQTQEKVVLQWPWQDADEAAAWVAGRLLGEKLASGCMKPFADKLALLPNAAPDVLGDQALCISCTLPMEAAGMPTWAIPPLSADLAKAIADCPDALQLDAFTMTVTEQGAVQASFTLKGQGGEVTFTRLYEEEDIVLLQPEETPTVAVWPSVAFPADQWKAYHVYTHGHGLTVSALKDGRWVCDDAHLWSVVRTDTFPVSLAVHQQGVCLGALINQLPVFQPEMREHAVAALDLGMTGTTVALRLGEKNMPMQLPCLVRTLLHGSKPAPFELEFLPAEAIGGILPSQAAVIRSVEHPQPLVDGHTGGAEQPEYVHGALKWSTEGTQRQACLMHLHQTMMTASLCAKMNGACDMAWRLALPSDLSTAGWVTLMESVRTLAETVALETCLPLTASQTAVRCVDENQALTAYLKASGYQRGGFIAMDVGSSDVSMMLWLRGMNRPCAVTHLPLGIHGMVLQGLMRQPQTFEEDFAAMENSPAKEAVHTLATQLQAARGSRKAVNRCMLLLDDVLGKHGTTLHAHMNQVTAKGGTTLLQSLLLCGFAWLMTTAGLQLERAWQDASVNDHLPQEVPLCLCGRGGMTLLAMPDALKMRLTRFMRLGMSADNAVRQVYVIPSAEPKLEVALGALQTAESVADRAEDVPCMEDLPLPIEPQGLLHDFLRMFAGEFPLAAQQLWPDLIGENGLLQEASVRLQTVMQMQREASPAALVRCMEMLKTDDLK